MTSLLPEVWKGWRLIAFGKELLNNLSKGLIILKSVNSGFVGLLRFDQHSAVRGPAVAASEGGTEESFRSATKNRGHILVQSWGILHRHEPRNALILLG